MVSGFQKTSLIDFPGNICATVFLSGCNFRCPYCHNGDLLQMNGSMESYESQAVLEEIRQRRRFLDGVCVTGGEPTLQTALPSLLTEIKGMGLKVKLDTNGSRPTVLRQLLAHGLVDFVAMDIKAPPERYSEVSRTKVDIAAVSRSVAQLLSGSVEYEFRTTAPRSLLDEGDFLRIGQWLKGGKKYVLQRYQPEHRLDPDFTSDEQGSDEWLRTMAVRLSPYFEQVQVRGLVGFIGTTA